MWAINKFLGTNKSSEGKTCEENGIVLSGFSAQSITKTEWCVKKDVADGKGGFTDSLDACAYECDTVKVTWRLCAKPKKACRLVLKGKVDISGCCEDDDRHDHSGNTVPDAEMKIEETITGEDGPVHQLELKDSILGGEGHGDHDHDHDHDGDHKSGPKKALIFELLLGDCDSEICDARVLKTGILKPREGCVPFTCKVGLDCDACEHLECGGKIFLRVLYGTCSLCICFSPDDVKEKCDTIDIEDSVFGNFTIKKKTKLFEDRLYECGVRDGKIVEEGKASNECQCIPLIGCINLKCIPICVDLDATLKCKSALKLCANLIKEKTCIVKLPCKDSSAAISGCIIVKKKGKSFETGEISGEVCFTIKDTCLYDKELLTLTIRITQGARTIASKQISPVGQFLGPQNLSLCESFMCKFLKFGNGPIKLVAPSHWKTYLICITKYDTLTEERNCDCKKEICKELIPECEVPCKKLFLSLKRICSGDNSCITGNIETDPKYTDLTGSGLTVLDDTKIPFIVNVMCSDGGSEHEKECDCAIFKLVLHTRDCKREKKKHFSSKCFIPVVVDCSDPFFPPEFPPFPPKKDDCDPPVDCDIETFSPGFWFSAPPSDDDLAAIFAALGGTLVYGSGNSLTITSPAALKNIGPMGGDCPLMAPLVDPVSVDSSVRHALTIFLNIEHSKLGDGCLGDLCFVDMENFGEDDRFGVLDGLTVQQVSDEIESFVSGNGWPTITGLDCDDINKISELIIDTWHEGVIDPELIVFFNDCS